MERPSIPAAHSPIIAAATVTSSLVTAAALALCALSTPRLARAQTDEAGSQTMVRRGLIDAMQSAQRASDWARCVDLGQRAASIRDTSSLRRVIAICQQNSSHFTAALASAELCLSMARRDPASPQREQIIASCEQSMRDAQGRTGRVTVLVPNDAPEGARVTLAGNELPRVAWGVAALVDADTSITVVAEAPGYTAFRSELRVAPGTTRELRVEWTRAPEPANTTSTATTSTSSTANTASAANTTSTVTASTATARSGARRAIPSRTHFQVTPVFATGIAVATTGLIATSIGWALAVTTVGAFASRCEIVQTEAELTACRIELPRAQTTVDAGQTTGVVGIGLTVVGAGLLVWGGIAGRAQRRASRPREPARARCIAGTQPQRRVVNRARSTA